MQYFTKDTSKQSHHESQYLHPGYKDMCRTLHNHDLITEPGSKLAGDRSHLDSCVCFSKKRRLKQVRPMTSPEGRILQPVTTCSASIVRLKFTANVGEINNGRIQCSQIN